MFDVIQTDHLPPGDRFEFWWEAVAKSTVPVHASSDQAANFSAEMRSLDLGPVRLSRVRCGPFEARRTERLIRESDPDLYQMSLILRGRYGLHQARHEADLMPTDLVLYDTSRAFHAWTRPERHAGNNVPSRLADGLVLQFPRDVLPMPRAIAERFLARRLPGGDGVGALLAGLLRRLMTQPTGVSPSDLPRLSTIILDLVAALAAHELEADASNHRAALFLQIQAFIEQHLGEGDLTPPLIAAAHHISTRQLHRLFQQEELTVAEWIRSRRLERCRRDLADPLRDQMTVRTVASRWRFTSDAHFNRIFREVYGMPPATYRLHCQEHRSTG